MKGEEHEGADAAYSCQPTQIGTEPFFNGLHGRALPAATAIAVTNPELTTVVVTGEGDCYGEGGNHYLHALRRNPNLTVVVHDNRIYALTKGQGSPTTPLGEPRSIQFEGMDLEPLNPLGIAIVQGCTFVARGFAAETEHLADLLVGAIRHPGLSVVDVIQPCITWGPHSVSWYKERVYELGGGLRPRRFPGCPGQDPGVGRGPPAHRRALTLRPETRLRRALPREDRRRPPGRAAGRGRRDDRGALGRAPALRGRRRRHAPNVAAPLAESGDEDGGETIRGGSPAHGGR
ncbi:MAG: thiamine pyrophosphate-dependent enzyme [Deferrisomatales bacterium]|nr:thiamine pyrophosphate-dependent enzyme [Deferrisomatales bacterium]